MIKRLLIYFIAAFLTLIIFYFILKLIRIEDQHLIQPGWHTTDITGKPLLKLSLIYVLIITVIANGIFSIIRHLMAGRHILGLKRKDVINS